MVGYCFELLGTLSWPEKKEKHCPEELCKGNCQCFSISILYTEDENNKKLSRFWCCIDIRFCRSLKAIFFQSLKNHFENVIIIFFRFVPYNSRSQLVNLYYFMLLPYEIFIAQSKTFSLIFLLYVILIEIIWEINTYVNPRWWIFRPFLLVLRLVGTFWAIIIIVKTTRGEAKLPNELFAKLATAQSL